MKTLFLFVVLLLFLGSLCAVTVMAETNTFSISPQTLPVELSAFVAQETSTGFVSLYWITESETELLGFRIHRGETLSLQASVQICAELINATNTSSTQFYGFIDREVEAEMDYYYWLESVNIDGSSIYHNPVHIHVSELPPHDDPPEIPLLQTGIKSIFPNPFNPHTYVSYSLDQEGFVSMAVYNHRGQLVRHLFAIVKPQGDHFCSWDGKDGMGKSCASGVYYFRMQANGKVQLRKALLMK